MRFSRNKLITCVILSFPMVALAPLLADHAPQKGAITLKNEEVLENAYQGLRNGLTLKEPLAILGAISIILRISPPYLPEDIDLEQALNEAALLGKSDLFIITKTDQMRDSIEALLHSTCTWQYVCKDDQNCDFKYRCH